MLAGMIGGKVCMSFGFSKKRTLVFITTISLLWEIVELFLENQLEVYKTYERWAWDTAGDIVGSVMCCVIVII